jgi:hypothetical protein
VEVVEVVVRFRIRMAIHMEALEVLAVEVLAVDQDRGWVGAQHTMEVVEVALVSSEAVVVIKV